MSRSRLCILLLALCAGPALGLAAAPALFARIPTHSSRVGVALAALRDPALGPSVAVLGNSVAMAGVDGRLLERTLPGGERVLHLASGGQAPVESLLFYDALPEAVGAVVLVLAPSAGEVVSATGQRLNNFAMAGYRPRPSTLETIRLAYGVEPAELLEASELLQRFRSRWIVHQWTDLAARRWLRKDVLHERVATDLSFPAPFAGSLAREDRERRIAGREALARSRDLRLDSGDLLAAETMLDDAESARRQMVLVLPPQHPRVTAAATSSALSMMRAHVQRLGRRPNASVVDATTLLRDEEFYDDTHPTLEGAARLTREIGRALARLR